MVQEATGGATNPNCPRFKGDRLPTVSAKRDGRKAGGLSDRTGTANPINLPAAGFARGCPSSSEEGRTIPVLARRVKAVARG